MFRRYPCLVLSSALLIVQPSTTQPPGAGLVQEPIGRGPPNRSGERLDLIASEDRGEFVSAVDPEFGVGGGEVVIDGADGEVEAVGDMAAG